MSESIDPAARTQPGTGNAKERLKEQGRTIREDVRELGDIAREAASETLDEARTRAEGYVREKKERAEDVEEELVRRIRERPIRSVLVAAGAGALLGMLCSRR